MTMRGIHDDHIHGSLYQRFHTGKHIGCNTDGASAQKTSLCVFGRQRIFDLFLNILDGDQAF